MGVRVAPPLKFKPDLSQLTAKQRGFVEQYLKNGENAAEAYRIGYGSKASQSAISQEANKALRHPKIRPILDAYREKAMRRVEKVAQQHQISKERVAQALADIAFGTGKYAQPLRPADQRQALMDLAKLNGWVIDRSQVRFVRSVTDLTDDELDALAAEGLPQIEGTAEDVEE